MGLLDFLYPPRCKLCGSRVVCTAVCDDCKRKLYKSIKLRKIFISANDKDIEATVLFPYENQTVKDLLFALKENSDSRLFEFAGDLYGMAVADDGKKYAVVNVPRSIENRKKFGYDHVEKPCRKMCRKRENLIFCPVLKRKGKSTDQKKLDSKERRRNAEGKFRAIKKDIPQNILIVDDVVTTASTAKECAKVISKVYSSAKIKFVFLAGTGLNFSGK